MPSIINKNSLLSQIDSIIASLNLSTDESRKLALYYKTAINAGSNTIYSNSNIALELISRLENTTSTDSKELLMLATGSSVILDDRMVTVANTTVLNALANVSAGTIYFVESDGYPYIRKSDNTWTPLSKARKVYNAWSWGRSTAGQLGDGTNTNRSSPVSVVGGFTDWVSLEGGGSGNITVGLRSNGTIWAWGENLRGQIGDGTTVAKNSPVSVIGGFTDWTVVSAGRDHCLGIRANGTLWGWGDNVNGELADGTLARRSSPVSVIGGYTDWIAISASFRSNIGLRANGTAWTWGVNDEGQLGDGTTSNRSSPISVIGGFTDWIQVCMGDRTSVFTLGIRSNGTLWAWGNNGDGRLGDGTISNRSSPVSVVGGFTDWVSVCGGARHTIALRANGTLWAWGLNTSGQLGTGLAGTSSPVSVVGGFTDWVSVSAGSYQTIGLRANGTLWGWGANDYGRVGDGTTTNRGSPVSVIGGFTDWVSIPKRQGHWTSHGIRA